MWLLLITTLGAVGLAFWRLNVSVRTLQVQQALTFQEVQHQSRVTRKALVSLVGDGAGEEPVLHSIVNSSEFQLIVEQDAKAQCVAKGIRWFGESEQEANEAVNS